MVEILAIKSRSNDAINGLSIQETTFKISQYADDLTLILSDLQSVSSSINTIKQFSKVARPKLNLDKTEGLLIGNLKNSNIEEYMGISITNRLTKVLGIYIGNTQIQFEELNWNEKLNKIQNILNLWVKRNLTIFGKAVVINTLCISKLVYNFLLIPVPEYVIKKLENMIINFLFKSRQRLKCKCLINTVKNNYQKSDWQNVYLRKIKSIPCKKIAEFNYKWLQNLLITGYILGKWNKNEFNYKLLKNLLIIGYILGKWNKNISSTCTYCHENDTPEHLSFYCNRTKRIWEEISYALKLNLTYKHLALGLDEDAMQNVNTARNNVISVIAYGIYCTWVKCEDSKQSYKYISLNQSVKHYIYHYNCIFQASETKRPWFNIFNTYCNKILSLW